MKDTQKEMFLAYLEHGRHIDNILLGFSRFMFALQTSTIAAVGYFLAQQNSVAVHLRSIGAVLMLLVGALIGILGVPVLTSIRSYSQAYTARRYPLELEVAQEIGGPDYRALIAAKQAETYRVNHALKVILIVLACLCLFGAAALIWLQAKSP
jgi:hypothetical protein